MRRLDVALTLLLFAGCALGPDYMRPPSPEPETYREELPAGESIADVAWWEMFGDSTLVDLIDTALRNNLDLAVALARIDEARAVLGIVRADLFPRVDYFADGSVAGSTAEGAETTTSALTGLAASYQVDLWGRIRRSKEAALQEILASEEAYRGLTIALVAEVGNAYLLLRDLDNRLLISEQTVEARRQTLDVVESRFNAGSVSEVDLNQSQIQLFEAEASVHVFQRLRSQTENGLSLLLGSVPVDIQRGLPLQEQVLPPEVPVGLPSELLERRPDILEAERRLAAQTARIGVSEALKFPQFTLTADAAAQFDDVNSGIFGLAGQLFGPLFNAGANQRRVDVEVARTEQLLNVYRQTILNALREVENAMVAVRTYDAEYDARRRQVDAAQNAADLSWARYEGGLTSYLEVLDLQRSLFASQLQASETLQLRLTSIVQLYQALGGGWVAAQDTLGFQEN